MSEWIEILIPSLHPAELLFRGTVAYLGLVLLLRVVGRREAGGLGVSDLVVVLLAVNAVTTGMTGDGETIADGFILVLTVFFWSVVLDALSYRWPRLERILKAPPRPLIKDGRLNQRAMLRELMSREEVESQLRLRGVHDLGEVELALIEPSGMVSVVTKEHTDDAEPHPHPEI